MNILILYLAPNLARMIQEVLEMEGHTVTTVQEAAAAIQILEDHPDVSFLLLADNIHTSAQAQHLLTMLAKRPDLRRRTRIVAESAITTQSAVDEKFPGVIDDYLILPFTVDRLLECIELNAAKLPH